MFPPRFHRLVLFEDFTGCDQLLSPPQSMGRPWTCFQVIFELEVEAFPLCRKRIRLDKSISSNVNYELHYLFFWNGLWCAEPTRILPIGLAV